MKKSFNTKEVDVLLRVAVLLGIDYEARYEDVFCFGAVEIDFSKKVISFNLGIMLDMKTYNAIRWVMHESGYEYAEHEFGIEGDQGED